MKRQTGRRRHLNVVRKETWMRVKDPDALRRRRLNCNYTQRQLAFLVNKSQNAISKLETGQMKTLSEGFAIALAAVSTATGRSSSCSRSMKSRPK